MMFWMIEMTLSSSEGENVEWQRKEIKKLIKKKNQIIATSILSQKKQQQKILSISL